MLQKVYFQLLPGLHIGEAFSSQPAHRQLNKQDLDSEWLQVDSNLTTENICKSYCGLYYSNPASRTISSIFSSALLLAPPVATRGISEQCPLLLMPLGQLLGEATLQLQAVALGLALCCITSSTRT